MSTIPVEQERLDSSARFADDVRTEAMRIRTDVTCRRLPEAHEKLTQLHLTAAAALVSAHEASASLAANLAAPDPMPLELLDTPARAGSSRLSGARTKRPGKWIGSATRMQTTTSVLPRAGHSIRFRPHPQRASRT